MLPQGLASCEPCERARSLFRGLKAALPAEAGPDPAELLPAYLVLVERLLQSDCHYRAACLALDALDAYPRSSDARKDLARVLEEWSLRLAGQGKTVESTVVRDALSRLPGEQTARADRSREPSPPGVPTAAGRNGPRDERLEGLRAQVAAQPGDEDTRLNVFELLGHDDRLVRFYRELCTEQPDSADHLLNLARAYVHRGAPAMAVVYYQKHNRLRPTARSSLELGAVYRMLGKDDLAAKVEAEADHLE